MLEFCIWQRRWEPASVLRSWFHSVAGEAVTQSKKSSITVGSPASLTSHQQPESPQ